MYKRQGMKDTNKTGNKILGFVQGEKELLYDIGNGLKQAVEAVSYTHLDVYKRQ